MPVKPRILDVLDTLIVAISAATNSGLTSQGLTCPGQTYSGHAISTKLASILSQLNGNHANVLWPLAARPTTRFNSRDQAQVTKPIVMLTATISNSVITLAGAVGGAYNVHVIVDGLADAFVQTAGGQEVDDVAGLVADAINALGYVGVEASAVGPAVSVTGANLLQCNIGGTGSKTLEVGRVDRLIQVSIYAPDPDTRSVIGDAIQTQVGTADNHSLTLSDGQALYVMNGQGEALVEKAQSSYSAFEWHQFYEVSYPLTRTLPATQIGAVKSVVSVNALNATPVTVFSGGPA